MKAYRGNTADGVWVFDQVFPLAKTLRQEFDRRFSNVGPGGNEGRFVWDYWNVPDQYTLLRTPAAHFFGPKLFDGLTQSLLRFGRENFGCTGLTPPWLSCYVEGCQQQFHVDMPHGPLAYVWSLTPHQAAFVGGETQFIRPEVLDYWKNYDRWNGAESEAIVGKIAPRFGRLVVFDPRVPHGVSEVRGVHDVRKARLVIHGWFSNPQPAIDGGLSPTNASRGIQEILADIDGMVADQSLRGLISFSFMVSPAGKVGRLQVRASTLQIAEPSHRLDASAIAQIERSLGERIAQQEFARAKKPTRVTLPLVFD
ncbi:MAG: 2OG-Fe(II) oxygenase [Bdellovibrionales bacterium]|nr:2OG-Fe(II) oxygenase [Bdellovibrionales bacterium]